MKFLPWIIALFFLLCEVIVWVIPNRELPSRIVASIGVMTGGVLAVGGIICYLRRQRFFNSLLRKE